MKEKNKNTHIAVLVICAILYFIIFLLMGPLRGKPGFEFLSNYMGVLSSVLVVLTTIMVMTNSQRGFIVSCVLCGFSAMSAGMSVLQTHTPHGLPGVLTPIINIATLSIIINYMKNSQKQQEELNEQYEKTMDANRIVNEQNEMLKTFAYQDQMTGMKNLTYCRQQMKEMIQQKKPFTVLYLDLDNFKATNDTFGPRAGDSTLKIYASRITVFSNNNYVCARASGDEFVLLLTGEQTEAQILNVVEQLRHMFSEPITVQGVNLAITASYGIASYPRDGINEDLLLDNAIMAVYNAKANGKDRPCFYS